ncbi:transglutaminase family protein [Kineococcus glutinatus]|uniref:Transglutaminase family protein n=1 Tax=Kineococcus glutinatus TaxID=1070872 RepID=A0ABP9HLC0_9ACTN
MSPTDPFGTAVRASLVLSARTRVECALQVAVARRRGVEVLEESLAVTREGEPVELLEDVDRLGGRLHAFSAGKGTTRVDYSARVRVDPGAADTALTPRERWQFTRPSRYCESDRLAAVAAAEFVGTDRAELPAAVTAWVHERLDYVSGSSDPTDGAVDTLLAGQGVCRDHAHLVVALLRALDVPARLVAVYAPGLEPMDFHAVVEAAPDDRWQLQDATRLAPRASLLRISTGRDAADTAFLSNTGITTLEEMEVLAVAEGDLPAEEPAALVRLA